VITRRTFVAIVAAGACVWSLSVAAQQSAKIWRIGFLGLTSPRAAVSVARVEALRAGLRELGYIEGKNIAIEFRWADGDYDRLPGLAEELVRQKVDVLVTYSTPGAMAARRATQSIPIVLASVADPVATGLVKSLRQPGGNITGSSIFSADETAKRLELLKDAFPQARRVALLTNPGNAASKATALEVEKVARTVQLDVQIVEVRVLSDIEGAFAKMAGAGIQAVLLFEDPLFTGDAARIAALALRHRMISIGPVAFAEAGGLIGNGANQLYQFRRAAEFVDKILKGAKPGELPIQQAARFELIVNMNTATALGVSMPKALQFRADRIIE
jgi:putative tryptophan/tyrosine transport system substrate-binding protein